MWSLPFPTQEEEEEEEEEVDAEQWIINNGVKSLKLHWLVSYSIKPALQDT